MAVCQFMGIKNRIATCLLLNKLVDYKKYSQEIGIQDSSHYKQTDQTGGDIGEKRENSIFENYKMQKKEY